jgi:hypothetical protein
MWPGQADWGDDYGKQYRKERENEVDKSIGDGQNPYHSHSLASPMTAPCKHPIVKVVSREEDTEFVECQACGEIFDSAEFSDIAIEEEAMTETPDD